MIFNKNIFPKCRSFFSKVSCFLQKNHICQYLLMAFIIVFICEIFSQRSFDGAIVFFTSNIPVLLVNYAIVLICLFAVHFLPKRNFWKYAISGVWILLSVINYVMFSFRLMPFSFNDLLLIPSTFTVIPLYLSVFQIILIVILIVALILLIVYIYRKTPKVKINYKRDIFIYIGLICLCTSYVLFSSFQGVVDKRVLGLINKYEQNGFVYCYTSSIFERGMAQPDSYSSLEVSSILKNLDEKKKNDVSKPNIVFLQLESFFDVNNIKELLYAQNPIPVFNSFEEEFSHGYLTVPTFSAGTANTEFEVLTGMNVDFLGIGEVAYQTVVPKGPIETACHHLKRSGYKTHAIHNNHGTFYNRNVIYGNLGFDTFTSLEYMYDVEFNALGWARDKVLITSITDCIKSSNESDFIYTVGVQTHGTYPDNITDTAPVIEVTGFEDNEKAKRSFEYYISQMKEVDTFVGDLTKALKALKEPTVLVIFGDHLPGFEVDDGQLVNDSKYQTEYIMWSNFDMDYVIKDLYSYQLYSYVLDRLGFNGGAISKVHKKYAYSKSDEYMNDYEIIQYDMLEGEMLSYGSNPPEYVNTRMGIRDISIKKAYNSGDKICVEGSEFTQSSKICVNGDLIDTEYINTKEIVSDEYNLELGDVVSVCQVDDKSNILSQTQKIVYE